MKARAFAAGAALTLFACSTDTPPPVPGSFDRPNRMTLVCFDLRNANDPKPVALDECNGSVNARGELISTKSERSLHALVLQSSRGEVAAVDLHTLRTLDSRRDIPGYTFIPVGELPSAIVVPPNHPEQTYVANAGSRNVTVLSTRAFRKLEADNESTLQVVALPGDANNAPYDMLLSPDEDALFVSQPDAGKLLRLPIQRCDSDDDAPGAEATDGGAAPCVEGGIDEANIVELPLEQSQQMIVAPMPDLPAIEPYARLCTGFQLHSGGPAGAPMLPEDLDQLSPRPSGLAIDDFCESGSSCPRRLLVADAALPLIHVIDLDALTVQTPLISGVPTRNVAVTPRVPVSLADDAAETQYVYAIDGHDGSLLVLEDGALLSVGAPGARPDRVTLGPSPSTNLPGARTLTVLTPAFDDHGPAAQYAQNKTSGALPDPASGAYCVDTTHITRSNRRLRGVFVATGLSDGSVRVVDVHDMDLKECRATCTPQDPYPLVRHRVRIVATLPENAEITSLAPQATPRFEVGTSLIPVRDDGTTSDPLVEGLDCVKCPADQATAFPIAALAGSRGSEDDDAGAPDAPTDGALCDDNRSRICALSDPWADVSTWFATYEGRIPATRGGQGRFAAPDKTGPQEFLGELHFCSRGVLGTDDIGGGKPGDQLSIVSALAPDAAIRAAAPDGVDKDDLLQSCRALVRTRDDPNRPKPISFAIKEAYDDRLVIEPRLISPAELDRPLPAARDIEFVNACFGDMLVTYEVRTRKSYTVVEPAMIGFVHRVKVDEATGRCAVDETQDPKHTGRAYAQEPFDNGHLTFMIKAGEPPIDSVLAVALSSTTPKAVMDGNTGSGTQFTAVPSDLRWSDTSGALYMVDVAIRGLLTIPVDPFPSAVPTSIR